MGGQSGLSELSVISWVSAFEGCLLSGVPLYRFVPIFTLFCFVTNLDKALQLHYPYSHAILSIKTHGNIPLSSSILSHLQTRLREMYTNPARRFHLSSIQFSLHYSFESYSKAHMMLRNACENLRPGGYLIGTTVDADELV